MDGTLTAGKEPVGLGPYGTLLAILKLKDVSDLEFVSVKDIEKALPDDATLQHKVDCHRLLKQAKEARHRPSSVYSSESTTPSILASAAITSTSEDAKSLAGVLRLQPPDGKVWQGTSDKRPATAFLYRVAESARLAALSEMDTWRYLTAVCLQQSQARELDNYLSKNIASDATTLDRLQAAELWFNNRWSITNNVDKIYAQLRDINHISFVNVEALHDTIVNLQQHARYLNHEIPLTALRRAFLDGLPNWLRQPLLQVHPQATTPLHVMVDWCTSYEESSGRKLTTQSVPSDHLPTTVCRLNLQGRCTYGTRCKFLHTTSSTATPIPPATFPAATTQEVCRKFRAGNCIFGDKCKYSHAASQQATANATTAPAATSTATTATTTTMPNPQAVTTSMAQLNLRKTSHCLVTVPTQEGDPTKEYVALIDTGSCESMISHNLVAELGLPLKYLDVPYIAYIMNGDCIMYHATVTLTWRLADEVDTEINTTFLVSPRLPEPFQFVFGSDLQQAKGFNYNPITQKLVLSDGFRPVQPQTTCGVVGPTAELSPTSASYSSSAFQASDTSEKDQQRLDNAEIRSLNEEPPSRKTTVVMETPSFIITVEADPDDPETRVFTVDIKPESVPVKKPCPKKLSQQHPLNKPDPSDPTLFDETRTRLEGLIQRGCLRPVPGNGDDDGYEYLTTTYYGVRGAKRARPVFPFRNFNKETKQLLKNCPVRQDPLYSILDATRGYGTLQLMDVSDAFFRIKTGIHLRRLMTRLFEKYHFPTTLVDVSTVQVAPFLGLETVEHGCALRYSLRGWEKFSNFELPNNPTLRDALTLLGKIMTLPEVLPFFLLPTRNLLQSLVAKCRHQLTSWDAELPPFLLSLLREFHDTFKNATPPTIQRHINVALPVKIFTDAGAYCGCYRFFQNDIEILRGQHSFTSSEVALHINCKELMMVLLALQRMVLLEMRMDAQFKDIQVFVDSKTVLSILQHGRTTAGPMQVYMEKKLRLLQELLGERLNCICFTYIETKSNLAGIGTRDDLHKRLIQLRDCEPPQQAHEAGTVSLQAAVIPSTLQPIAGKRQRQISSTDADPVVKKICTRPYQAPLYLTREALGQPCRERDELLLKGIIVQDPTGLARLAGTQRLYVPSPLQPLLLQRYHDYYAHPGKKALYDLASRHWWFPRMSKVCNKYPCLSCILCKSYHNRKLFGHLPQPHKPLSYLAIDFTGPYANTKHPYAVTISDMYTRLFRVYPTERPATDSICKALEDWRISYGQYPELLMHDNDKAFSTGFAQWCSNRCIREARTAIYSPESNSAAERPHRTFHDGIRSCLYLSDNKDWVQHADSVVYRMNATKNSTTGQSPYSMLLNIIPRCPFFDDTVHIDGSSFPADHICLFPAGTVVARRVEQPLKLEPRYEGSYEVLSEVRPGTFRIRRLGSTSPPIDVKQDRLKAYPISQLIQHF